MGWMQIFHLLERMHQHVATAVHHPELYIDVVKDVGESSKGLAQYAVWQDSYHFANDVLLLGSKPHDQHSFVTTYIREQKVKCIFVDKGLIVNIMPKFAMYELGTMVEKPSKS